MIVSELEGLDWLERQMFSLSPLFDHMLVFENERMWYLKSVFLMVI